MDSLRSSMPTNLPSFQEWPLTVKTLLATLEGLNIVLLLEGFSGFTFPEKRLRLLHVKDEEPTTHRICPSLKRKDGYHMLRQQCKWKKDLERYQMRFPGPLST